MKSIISASDTWSLLAIIASISMGSMYLEQKYRWAARISGPLMGLIGALILANTNIIPTEAPAYDIIWAYVIPLAIPLLLFNTNILKIWKESGRLLTIFCISSFGTVLGAFTAFGIFKNHIPYLAELSGIMTGSYVGGGVNFVALTESFKIPPSLTAAVIVADNLILILCFLVLSFLAGSKKAGKFWHKIYPSDTQTDPLQAKNYWKPKEASLKDITFSLGISLIIVAVSTHIAVYFGRIIPENDPLLSVVKGFLSNKYVIITTLSCGGASLFSSFFEKLSCAEELGMFLIYQFFVVLGVPASLYLIVTQAPLLLGFCLIIMLINMGVSLLFGKVLGYRLEEILLAINATIGGPTTGAAFAIAQGWTKHVAPVLLVGTLGYIFGNYCGILVAQILMRT